MAFIHGCQQADILGRVFAGKAGHRALSALALTGFAVLSNQPGDLLAGIAADLHQVADQDTFILFLYPVYPVFDSEICTELPESSGSSHPYQG